MLNLIAAVTEANGNTSNESISHSQAAEQNAGIQKKDSLPEGVTQDWLNSLRDEDGNKINFEEPETDAMVQNIFNAPSASSVFGGCVSSAGDVNDDGYSDIIVGAWGYSSNTGRAYIFYGGSPMNNIADVTMTGEATNNLFGISVSSAGDVNNDGFSDVIVGAYTYSSNTGRAYIYFGGSSMNNVADVTMTGETTENFFGRSVSKAGDVNSDGFSDVIVGAYGYSTNTGRAYIYFGGSSMNNVADVIMTGEAINNYFGESVSTAGDVNGDGPSDVIVGASGYSANTGRAYIYFGGSSMNNVADVNLNGETTGNFLGASVSSAGDVNDDGYSDVIVGAYGYSSNTGRAYIYEGGLPMNNSADVTMTGEAVNNRFGISVSSAGDMNGDGYSDVIVGAYQYLTSIGRAYIYFGGSSMNNSADLTMTGETTSNYFGTSVSEAGDVNADGYSDVIVGATGYSSNTGRVYLYDYHSNGGIISDITMTGAAASNVFGGCVSSAGDVNDDGYSDVIVGAWGYSSNTGRAYIFFGGSPINNIADVTLTGEATNNLFGISVSSAGDVNNDSYSDVIVGAYLYSSNTGRSYIYFGGSSMNNVADVTMTGETTENFFGRSVSSAGDVNNDSYSDVIVGAYGNFTNTGRAYIYLGGSSMNNVADIIMSGEAINNYFGESVSTAGDVNGDGYSDVIVGASGYSANTGRAYIYFGGSSMNNVADVNINGEATGNFLGASVSSAGNVNDDGYSDVIVGAYGYSTNTGRAYIYFGGSSMNNVADVTMTGEAVNNRFGISVSSAGDMNGDGFSEVIVGAYQYLTSIGRAYIYFGGSSMNNVADLTMTGEAASNYFGTSVSGAGDVNADGYSDVIVGATGFSSNTGRAYIFLGSAISPYIKINLTMFIQGFYNAGSNSQVGDTITAYLRNSNSPYNIIDQHKSFVSANGIASLKFSNAMTGTYFLVLKHRNSIETWSAAGNLFRRTLIPADYDFSISSSQAYGNNQKQIDTSPVRFAIYSGDGNQDGTVDVTDIVDVYNDALIGNSGYVSTDMNGDDFVDAADIVITYNNAINIVSVVTP